MKKEVHWLKSKWHRTTNREEKQKWGVGGDTDEKERHTCLSVPSLWYDKFMHSSCVCQSRPGVFVGLFLREEGVKKREERKEGKKARKRKRGERAEKLSSNSRKWVDPYRGRLCSLCGFNKSTVFRTQRGTRDLA